MSHIVFVNGGRFFIYNLVSVVALEMIVKIGEESGKNLRLILST